MLYCFSRSSIKFQGHTGQKITNFDSNWAFLDCKTSLNSLMAMKWCTCKAWRSVEEVPYYFLRSSIKFEDHPGPENCRFESNLINTNVLLGRSQLSNPSDWPCFFKLRPSSSMNGSVRLSVTTFSLFVSSYHHEISRSNYHWQKWCPCKKSRSEVKRQGQRAQKNF